MKNFCLIIFLTLFSIPLFSQHIGYRDESRKHESPSRSNPVKEKPAYINYKDMCPGRSAELPILNNYVPELVVKTLKQKYKGYLYSITSIKLAENLFKFKVSVCNEGITRIEFVDEAGLIVP